jgi:hypothetical protein
MTSRATLMALVKEKNARDRDSDIEAFEQMSGHDLTDMRHLIKNIGQSKDGTISVALNLDSEES